MAEYVDSNEHIISDAILEKIAALEERRASRPTVDDIMDGLRADYLAQQPAREALLARQLQAVSELTVLGVSEESAQLIVGIALETENVESDSKVKPSRKRNNMKAGD